MAQQTIKILLSTELYRLRFPWTREKYVIALLFFTENATVTKILINLLTNVGFT